MSTLLIIGLCLTFIGFVGSIFAVLVLTGDIQNALKGAQGYEFVPSSKPLLKVMEAIGYLGLCCTLVAVLRDFILPAFRF